MNMEMAPENSENVEVLRERVRVLAHEIFSSSMADKVEGMDRKQLEAVDAFYQEILKPSGAEVIELHPEKNDLDEDKETISL